MRQERQRQLKSPMEEKDGDLQLSYQRQRFSNSIDMCRKKTRSWGVPKCLELWMFDRKLETWPWKKHDTNSHSRIPWCDGEVVDSFHNAATPLFVSSEFINHLVSACFYPGRRLYYSSTNRTVGEFSVKLEHAPVPKGPFG